MGKPSINDCLLIDLPQILDPRGALTFIESRRHLPFNIQRVYYIYDVPSGSHRGGHAHRQQQEFLIAISGSFDIHLDDGIAKTKISLNRSHLGLRILPLVWREVDNFSPGSVCLVLASAHYKEDDYIRDYRDFMHAIREAR
jgi:dTDP-4-dehydrorhamnose 3,5-epimerase-like enzyme